MSFPEFVFDVSISGINIQQGISEVIKKRLFLWS